MAAADIAASTTATDSSRTIGRISWPAELFLHLFSIVLALDVVKYQLPAHPVHIATDPFASPLEHPLAHVSSVLRRLVTKWYSGTFTFTYTSAAEGSHRTYNTAAATKNKDSGLFAAHDLEKFLSAIPDKTLLRKLDLSMHASELLMLFAPAQAAELLNLPAPEERGVWTRVRRVLQECTGLRHLGIGILERTCPSTCRRAADMPGKMRESDGSVPVRFVADYPWIVKSVLETVGNRVPHHGIIRITLSNGRALEPREVDEIAGCSWTMLDSGCASRHVCDVLLWRERTGNYGWAVPGERSPRYEVPVKASGVGGDAQDLVAGGDELRPAFG